MFRLISKTTSIRSSLRLSSKSNLVQQQQKTQQIKHFSTNAKPVRANTGAGSFAEDTGDFILFNDSPGAAGNTVCRYFFFFFMHFFFCFL